MQDYPFIKTETTLKDLCKLEVGSRFIFQGNYCTVVEMFENHFRYEVQGEKQKINRIMHYWFYLKTPSAIGRQLNKRF